MVSHYVTLYISFVVSHKINEHIYFLKIFSRGMHFENVSVLIASIVDIIKDMSYCWKDSEGIICSQKGVFRVNCIDCLDRTNVVQVCSIYTIILILK